MESDLFRWVVAATLWFGAAQAGQAVATDAGSDSEDWQERRLLDPTAGQLRREDNGRVFIYDGLEYGKVEQAMDRHFDRIQSMMFTRIHHPPSTATGPVMVEDDGCD